MLMPLTWSEAAALVLGLERLEALLGTDKGIAGVIVQGDSQVVIELARDSVQSSRGHNALDLSGHPPQNWGAGTGGHSSTARTRSCPLGGGHSVLRSVTRRTSRTTLR